MSRLIDADALIEKEERSELDRYIDGERCYQMVVPSWAIIEAPTIDAVSVVRCADCVYCNVQNTKYLYAICQKHGIAFKPFEDDTRTHGCTWGERKGE